MSVAVHRKAEAAFDERPIDAAPLPREHRFIGHSGASVMLVSEGLNSFVRKTAGSLAAGARLLQQIEKQRTLRMLGLPLPYVLSSGEDDEGRATFDMEYIAGRTVADAVLNASPFDVDAVLRAVERMLWLFVVAARGTVPPAAFEDKIAEIAAACDAPAVQDCARKLHACDWTGIPQSPCHGDLTLENIMLTARGDIAFIDCDEPWVSSWWLDAGKLFQDIDGHWCVRSLYAPAIAAVHRTNAIQKLDHLAARFRALMLLTDPALPARLPQLAALNLFRAAPYAKTPESIVFICARIALLLGEV